MSQFVYFTLSTPLLYPRKIENYGMREKKNFVYMTASAYHVLSKDVENQIFRRSRVFRHTCIYKQPMLNNNIEVEEIV